LKNTIEANFGKGMEHVKKIKCKEMTILNSGYSYKSAEIESVHIKDYMKDSVYK
jgi:hypothetical protein